MTINSTPAATFAAVAVTYLAAHEVADYWVQTDTQAQRKGLSGGPGRRACAAHVATYTATLGGCLAVTARTLGLPLRARRVALGLAVSAVTHYVADRRAPLRQLAQATGKGGFYSRGEGLASGAAALDQAWHIGWLFAAALLTARPEHHRGIR